MKHPACKLLVLTLLSASTAAAQSILDPSSPNYVNPFSDINREIATNAATVSANSDREEIIVEQRKQTEALEQIRALEQQEQNDREELKEAAARSRAERR